MTQTTTPSRDRDRRNRARLRAPGLRPVQISMPDVRRRSFVAAAREESRAVAWCAEAKTDQAWVNAVSADLGG